MFLLSLDLCLVKKKKWQKFYWSAQMNFVSLNQTFPDLSAVFSPHSPMGRPSGFERGEGLHFRPQNNTLDRNSSLFEILFNRFGHQLAVCSNGKIESMTCSQINNYNNGLDHSVKL